MAAFLLSLLLLLSQQGKDERTITGELASLEGRSLVLSAKLPSGAGGKITLKVAENPEILIDGKKAKLEELKVGKQVRVLIRDGSVQRIECPPPAEKAPPKAEEKPVPKAEEKPVPKPEVKPPPKPEEKPAPKPEEKPARPFPIDESVVPKGEKLPDLGGRVMSLFPDGPTTLVTIRQVNEELPFYLPKDAAVTYVGLEKPDQKPTVGYLVYVWLKPGSKDTAASVRFARAR